MFYEKTFCVFISHKNQRKICVAFKYGNVSEKDYQVHVTIKKTERDEKNDDKESANKKNLLWTIDKKAVL